MTIYRIVFGVLAPFSVPLAIWAWRGGGWKVGVTFLLTAINVAGLIAYAAAGCAVVSWGSVR